MFFYFFSLPVSREMPEDTSLKKINLSQIITSGYLLHHAQFKKIKGEVWKQYLPFIVTKTGCDFLTSFSGIVINNVRIEPKLVPIHNVGRGNGIS